MFWKRLRVLSLVGALVLFLTGSVPAQTKAVPMGEAEQPRTHTVTINNGSRSVRRAFVWQNDSWRSGHDLPRHPGPARRGTGRSPINWRMEELQKRMEQLHKRMQQFQRRGRMDLPGWPALPNQPHAPEPRTLSSQESRLGVQLGQPGATLVNQLDLPRDQGMVVEEVGPNAPAAKAGLKQHDILLEVDGKPVPSKRDEFDKLLDGIEANRKVEAVVMRKGKKETFKGLTLPEAKRPTLPD
jgi:hypothetical protein